MKGNDFKKLAVVGIEDGAHLGHVDDLRFDTKALKVAAICFEVEGQHSLVAFEDVRSIGNDAVTVQNRDVARSLSAETALANLPGLEQMQQLKVVDERGDYLGKVEDVEVDTSTGKIAEVYAHEGGVLGLGGKRATFTADQVRSVGDELIVVAARSSGGSGRAEEKRGRELDPRSVRSRITTARVVDRVQAIRTRSDEDRSARNVQHGARRCGHEVMLWQCA